MKRAGANTQAESPDPASKKFYKSPTNLIFIFAIIIIVVISIISVFQFYNLIRANRWVTHTYQVLLTTDEALYLITYMESRERGYLLFNDKAFINEFDENILKVKKSLNTLLELTVDNPPQQARIENFTDLVNQRIKMLNALIQLKLNNKLSSPEALAIFNQGQVISAETKSAADDITAFELVLLQDRNDTAIRETGTTNLIFIGGQSISIIFLLLSFVLFNRELILRRRTEIKANNVKSQLSSIIEESNDMIAALDLNYRFIIFNEAYKKEFERLCNKPIFIGMSFADALSDVPEAKNQLLETWRQSLLGHEYTKNIKFDYEGRSSVYEITSSLIKDYQHEIIGAVHIVRNISRRVQKQNALKESYEKLNKGMDQLKDKNEKITLLLEMSDVMLACNSTQELSSITVKFCGKVLNFSSGIFYIMEASDHALVTSAKWGAPVSQTNIFTQDQCWALRLSHIYQSGFSSNELVCDHIKNTNQEDLIYLCVPLRAKNDIFGLLYIEVSLTDRKEKQLHSDELLIINAFAELAALALANARLRESLSYQSIRDPLTTLYNRRHLEEFVLKQIHQAERNKTPLAILMLDIDHFKIINDTHGHSAGDFVLKELGQLLLNEIRQGDIASRYGGEEFILVLYNTDAKTAKERAEKIRKDISLMRLKDERHDIVEITVSIGIAVYPDDGKSEAELIEISDKALYFAKNSGRNKVVLSSEIKPG